MDTGNWARTVSVYKPTLNKVSCISCILYLELVAIDRTQFGKVSCGHGLRDHVRNDNTRETLKEENITEVRKSETEVVWTHEETRPRIRWKKDSGMDHLG